MKYTLTVTKPGSYSDVVYTRREDVLRHIGMLLSEKQPGESLNVSITKEETNDSRKRIK